MPGLSVAGFRLVNTPDHTWGFPCCIGLPFVCMLSPLPRWNCKVHPSLSSLAVAAFPKFLVSRLPHHVFRGLLSVHSRYGLHTRQVTYMTLYTGGFSRLVAFTTAPIATGWNESCRAGFAPAERPCLCTAHKKYYVIPAFGRCLYSSVPTAETVLFAGNRAVKRSAPLARKMAADQSGPERT